MIESMIEPGGKMECLGYSVDIYPEKTNAKCECNLCECWRQERKSRFKIMLIGVLVPLLWIYDSFKLVRYLYTDPVLKQSSLTSLYHTGESHKAYHSRSRKVLWSWLGYNMIAMTIELLSVVMLVVAAQSRPMDGTFLIEK